MYCSAPAPHRLTRHVGPAVAVLLLAVSFSTSEVQAQEKWRVLLGPNTNAAEASLKVFNPRPNVEQPFFLFVQKLENATENEVLVRLQQLRVKPAKDEKDKVEYEVVQLLAETVVATPDEKAVLVRFAGPKPEPKPVEPGKPAPPPPAPTFKPLLGTPGWALRAEVHDAKAGPGAKPLFQQDFEVRMLVPRDYLDIAQLSYEIGDQPGKNKFQLAIRAKDTFSGPPCPIELVLISELIPGLRTEKIVGNLKQPLTTDRRTIHLTAEGLDFEKAAPTEGVVAVTVDGYPRAMLFATNFLRTETTQNPQEIQGKQPLVRLLDHRKATVPVEKTVVHLEVNHAPTNARVELGIDRNRDKNYVAALGEVIPLLGDRQRRVGVAADGPGGAILLKTEVRDWQIEVDTAGFVGQLPYRVRVFDAEGKELLNDKKEPFPISVQGSSGHLVFDSTPPDSLRFPDLKAFPRELVRGERLRIEAAGKDDESEIDRVEFFVGKPVKNKEGKLELPANADPVRGVPVADKAGWWYAMLSGFDRVGTAHVTAQFVNKAGQSSFESVEIRLVEPGQAGAPAAGAKKAKISGTVSEGDRLQPDLEVVLKDDKGAVKGSTKTSKDAKTVGTFTFENVAPGTYTVSSSKVGSNTKGEKTVTVETVDVTGVAIQLFR